MATPNPSADKIILVFKVILGILGFLGFMYFFSFDDRSLDGYVRFVLSMGGVTFAGFVLIAIFFGFFPWLFERIVRIFKSLGMLKRTYETLTKICGILTLLLGAYLFWKGGTNFGWTAFFVLMGLAALFNSLDEKECEIEILRYEMWNFAFGGAKGKEEAQSYAIEHKMLLEIATRRMIEKYGSGIAPVGNEEEKLKADPQSYAYNPNRQKLAKDENVNVDENIKK